MINEMLNTGTQMTAEDKFRAIGRLLNIKDNLSQQINQAISY
jgi:hypothetical protein